MLWLIKKEGKFPTFITDGIYKWGIPSQTMLQELQSKGFVSGGTIVVSNRLFDYILTTHAASSAGGGSGLSFEETVEASREASRKGTG